MVADMFMRVVVGFERFVFLMRRARWGTEIGRFGLPGLDVRRARGGGEERLETRTVGTVRLG